METPTMLADMVMYQKFKKLPIHIEEGRCGGTPGSEKLFKDVVEILDVGRLCDGYGATEALAFNGSLEMKRLILSPGALASYGPFRS
ncbi:unnamed protein product [Diabrotica balteata]|uniref:Uncharacterized protein n=1 Tax=Diabrotica balteata TaxID=107213 RepID=A0A9N9TBM2_DIABA|nr:unnamed protein product [Diabrotica balteata]